MTGPRAAAIFDGKRLVIGLADHRDLTGTHRNIVEAVARDMPDAR
jgi:hypothetical protein